MTIRITCENCQSVLKIRDELAGTSAKCPKCKTAFSIPAAEVTLDDFIDIPREVTPPVDFFSDEEFDPEAALTHGGPLSPASGSAVAEAPRPSVAELMRQHEADMAKKKGRYRKPEKMAESAPAAARVMTVGTASEALTRTYDQKRGKAAEPRLTREEQRALEEKEAIKGFAIRGLSGLLAILIGGYFLQAWFFAPVLPDLGYVSGVVTQNNAPLAGVEVRFEPAKSDGGLELEIATPSSGFTNADGEYTLMFNPTNEGVIPGTCNVSIILPSGVSFVLPEAEQRKEVKASESHTYNFNL
ncbi:MAG: hypothetical protein R3C59_14025 [Planctomycetaceae bacterium]